MLRRGSRKRSGSSKVIWATIIEKELAKWRRPNHPAFLVITLCVTEGVAGVGWYDNNGLAEETFVASSATPRKISLTVWKPQECVRLIIRNVQNAKTSVDLRNTKWVRLNRTTLSAPRFPNLVDKLGGGLFLDQRFEGRRAEILWRGWKENRFDEARQYKTLSRLVWMAWQRCPGYRDLWQSQGWHPSKLSTLADINNIPIVTKELMRSRLSDFTVHNPHLAEFTTSGTTGSPFTFKYSQLLNMAHSSAVAIAATYGDAELLPWQQRAVIIRRSVRGASATGAGGSLIINASAVRDTNLICELIEAYRPTLLFGWPSYASMIAQSIGDKYQFRTAILGSENVLGAQIDSTCRIARAVVCTYGLSEGAGFAMRCHRCGAYSQLDTHGIISLNKRPDGLFDIIGTSFWSRGTLFIRYDSGDLTAGPVDRCPSCPDSMFHFSPPTGRSQEFVIDRHGAQQALAMIVGAERIVQALKNVQLFDFVHPTPGKLLLRYATADHGPIDEMNLLTELRRILHNDFEVTCRCDARILDQRRGLSSAQKWTILKRTDF
jgi:phenylacetate-CoA ligase